MAFVHCATTCVVRVVVQLGYTPVVPAGQVCTTVVGDVIAGQYGYTPIVPAGQVCTTLVP